MKIVSILLVTLSVCMAHAESTLKMNFVGEDLAKIIELYSKASGQKFVIDSTVRGKVTLLNSQEISLTEAFNQLSSALAINGFAISKENDTMIIRAARSVQRQFVQVTTELPSLQPERMVTWIYTVKNLPVQDLKGMSRMLSSMYGEMTFNEATNQIVFTDFTSSLNRIAGVLKEIDIKPAPTLGKFIEYNKKKSEERSKEFVKRAETKEIKEVRVDKKDE
jgi:type II secretory pathway component GspD/PulD (secretin)